jgi:hypothetical protein
MESRSFITATNIWAGTLVLLAAIFAVQAAPRIALVQPTPNKLGEALAGELSEDLRSAFVVVDPDLATSAFKSARPTSPLNMTIREAKGLASLIGCDAFAEIRAETQRRSAAGHGEYYEAYAVIYLVSGRTGRLIYWDLQKFEAPTIDAAEKGLIAQVSAVADKVALSLRTFLPAELAEPILASMEEPPVDGASTSGSFKAPIPFRRIKPEYTAIAAFYEVAATVEIEVDLDADGRILRTEIIRWAGFGLDETVERSVRAMNWRPAELDGKFRPMRFLLRYNFKKIEKD